MEVKRRRDDLKQIKKYLIRQTHLENIQLDNSNLNYFKSLSFIEFLNEVGMFTSDKELQSYSTKEKNDAYKRYLNALSASVRGTGAVFLKRGTKDVLTNNFNRKLMEIHKANHDIQIVVDQVKFYPHIIISYFTMYIIFSMHVPNMSLDTSPKMNLE